VATNADPELLVNERQYEKLLKFYLIEMSYLIIQHLPLLHDYTMATMVFRFFSEIDK